MLTVILPWPPKACSPNARGHWSKLASARKSYRNDCWVTSIHQGGKRIAAERLDVAITFVPPDKRRRDMDNMLSSCKAGLDGLADCLGVDDSKWRLTLAVSPERVRNGAVRVQVAQA